MTRGDPDSDSRASSQPSGSSSPGEQTPTVPAAREHLLTELSRFVRVLRRTGVSVPASGSLMAARALTTVGLNDRDRVSVALRASLLSETSDSDAFEETFPEFWHRFRSGFDQIAADSLPQYNDSDLNEQAKDDRHDEPPEDLERLSEGETPGTDGDDSEDGVSFRIPTGRRHVSENPSEESDGSSARRYSAAGRGQIVETTTSIPDDTAAIDQFLDVLGVLPSRRRRRSHRGTSIDAREALRRSLETGGAPLELPSIAPVESKLRCCLLVDVSGSVLDTVDRGALLAFADRLSNRARSPRVFLFDTDLVEATDAFGTDGDTARDPAAALQAAEIEWGGGTKIGQAFRTLRRTMPHAVDRRTVVIAVSDGLDVGEPEVLTETITWLSERSNATVWLNPLAVSSSFEPTARGISIIEPYVDAHFGYTELADLSEAARQIDHHGLSGSIGYEHDRRRIDIETDGGR